MTGDLIRNRPERIAELDARWGKGGWEYKLLQTPAEIGEVLASLPEPKAEVTS
jgi:hypothetical protein